MTITQIASTQPGTAVTIDGTVQIPPRILVRKGPHKIARVSFRIDTGEGPRNVHTNAGLAELVRIMLHKGDRVIIHGSRETISRPNQTIPDLEADSVEYDLR